MEENNLVLKIYRNKEDDSKLEMTISKDTTGLELYRISLTLLNKILEISKSQGDNIDTNSFLDSFTKDFDKILKKDK